MPPKDYYALLGVPRDATEEAIRSAYRKLARQYHPDVNKKPEAEKRFKEINEAHEVLSDPDKRKRYDTVGPEWEQFAQGRGRPSGTGGFQYVYTGQPGESPFGDDASGFSDFFRTLFGQAANGGFGDADDLFTRRTRTRTRARQGEDVEGEVEVTLPEAYKGTEHVIQISRETSPHNAHQAPRRLTVKIPPGVKDGQRIRLAGQGNPGANGGPPGDAYLRVRVKPHPFFTRDGDDLRVDLPVAMHEAMLGGEVTVPTLKGRVSLRIPPETQNGRTIRLAGQGMPRAGGGHGDLYSTVKVVMPTKLSEKERELAREVASSRSAENVRSHLL